MFGMETWMDFEQALQSDESMQSSFQTVVENLIRSGVQNENELLVRAAKELGRHSYGFEVSRDFCRMAKEQMLKEAADA